MTTRSTRVTLAQLEDAYTNLVEARGALERAIAESPGLMPELTHTVKGVWTKNMTSFMAVINQGSLNGAADLLGLRQDEVAEQVRRLEQSFGYTLVAYIDTGVTITPQGVPVYKWCMDTLNGLQDLTAHRNGATGQVAAPR